MPHDHFLFNSWAGGPPHFPFQQLGELWGSSPVSQGDFPVDPKRGSPFSPG